MSDYKLIIHIGFPKCLSTSLQIDFFESHPSIHYLGIKANLGYDGEYQEYIQENLLKYASERIFKTQLRQSKIEIAKSLNIDRVNVISNEHLSFKFSLSQIDTWHKYQRLYQLFGEYQPTIVAITRPIGSILKSLYKEYLKLGYTYTFNQFIIWLWNFRDRNFFYDLDYTAQYQYLQEVFGEMQVSFISYDELTTNTSQSINDFFARFGISNANISIQRLNQSIENNLIEALRLLNLQKRRELGAPAFEIFENHRNKIWFKRANAFIHEYDLYHDVYLKRATLSELASLLPDSNFSPFQLNKKGEECMANILKELE